MVCLLVDPKDLNAQRDRELYDVDLLMRAVMQAPEALAAAVAEVQAAATAETVRVAQ